LRKKTRVRIAEAARHDDRRKGSMKLSNFTVATRLMIGFGIMVILMLGVVAFSTAQLAALNDEVGILANDRVPKLYIAQKWVASVLQSARHMRNVFVLETKEEIREELVLLHDTKRERKEYLDQLTKIMTSGDERAAVTHVAEVRSIYIPDEDHFLELAEAGEFAKAKTLMLQKARPEQLQYIEALYKLIDLESTLVKHQDAKAAETYKQARTLLFTFGGGVLAIALIVSFVLSRGLSHDLTSAIQHMQSSSAELQAAASQQSSSAKEQASTATEVSTTLKELVATARQIGESAQRVAQLAEDSRVVANGGDATGTRAQEAVSATKRQVDLIVHHMLDLGKKSQQIGGVLDIINELSEQTNILSINATIEASGAGESGARFSAVAEEIRKLADRTAGSTKEIRTLVEEIRAGVNTTVMVTEGGSKAADAAAKQITEVAVAFGKIAQAVVVTTQAVQEIELSTKQQTTAVEQVNAAVAGVAQAAKDTEVSTSQTLQTAGQLATLSKDLTRLVRSDAAA
jgi:methyl-accepting chemotaxis protein